LYIALYKSYHASERIPEAVKSLNLCIKHFPFYSQGYLLRGKLLKALGSYDLAIKDLKKTRFGESNIHLSECWKLKKNYAKASKYLEKAKKFPELALIQIISKAKLDYKFQKYKESACALIEYLKLNPKDVEAIYYLAKSKLATNQIDESELLFEQVIQKSESWLSTRAVCKLAYIKLMDNNFYGAFHTFQRKKLELVSSRKSSLYKYAEAMLSVSKKKFKDSIRLFSELLSDSKDQDLQQKCYIYRAYSYFSISDYKSCASDYEKSLEICELDEASSFNYNLSKIMQKFLENDSESVLKDLDSIRLFQKNCMPKVIKVIHYLRDNSCGIYNKKAQGTLDSIIMSKKDSEILYLKALMLYFEQKYSECMKSINESICNADYMSCHLYILRGFCFIALKMYEDAFEDFSVSMSLSDNLEFIYPYRGICAFLCGKYSQAAEDMLRISDSDNDINIVLSAYLLIFSGNYNTALKLIKKFECKIEFLLLKAHCLLMNEEYLDCISCLEDMNCLETTTDIQIIKGFIEGKIVSCGVGAIFIEKYSIWMEGLDHIYNGRYELGLKAFETVIFILNTPQNLAFKDCVAAEEESCEAMYNIAICNIFINEPVNSI
jgi:tetratricopeptide (TPR) repeat protein